MGVIINLMTQMSMCVGVDTELFKGGGGPQERLLPSSLIVYKRQ